MKRESSWNSLLDEISKFCDMHIILILKVDDVFFI